MNESSSPAAADYYDTIIVGAGAAGLMTAICAAESGQRTLLLEKNRRPGVKILISGGTRCNITHATDNRGIIAAYGPPGRFLHSALAALSVAETVAFFEAEGLATKVEETGKIFPKSDRATDVLAALLCRLNHSGCTLATEEPLVDLDTHAGHWRLTTGKRSLAAGRVVLTTGGVSYPGCGTTGDGYGWAAKFGHTIVPPRPALVPITVEAAWVRALQGVTIPDVELRIVEPQPGGGKPRVLAERRGSLLFTHFGLSGPVALDVSREVSGHAQPRSLVLECDFLPGVARPALEAELAREFAGAGKRQLVAVLPNQLPRRLLESLLALAELRPDRKAAEVSKKDRARLVDLIKQLPLGVTGTLGFKKAEVTAGGVALDEVDSSTMQSKLAPNLYLAGEILDLDGPIGGYNFQAAWSTGWLAGTRRG